MQEKSTNAEEQPQTCILGKQPQACVIGRIENLIRANWEKIIKNIALFFLLVTGIMYVVPYLYGKYILSLYKGDSTAAGMHITIGTTLITAAITYYYVLLTGDLVKQSETANKQSEKTIEQSGKAIAQSRNAQEIMYIQTRLEKLYYPLKIVLNGHQINAQIKFTEEWISAFKADMYKVIPYFYLSSDFLNPLLDDLINIFYKNGTLIGKQITEKLEEKKQTTSLNGETPEPDLFEQSAPLLPSTAWELLLSVEIKKAINLYPTIVERIDTDISEYRNRLDELTTISK